MAFLLCLPLVALVSACLSRRVRAQNLFLLAFSLFFYGYWNWRYLGLLGLSIVVDYGVGLRISAAASAARCRWLLVSLIFNGALLGTFKYYDFFAESFAALLASFGLNAGIPLMRLALPIGISFYTFQSVSYTIDVYRRVMQPTRSLLDYALYVSFFPHLVAGPIQRSSLLTQIERPKRPSREQLREGGYLILYGLFQKVAIADAAAPLVYNVWKNSLLSHWLLLVGGAVAFSLQIYGDFAGYSNIARGCAKLLGVELMVNFRTPYFSTSVTEFWQRWHISLSSFLRDYLYIPLGGNRLGPRRTYLNLMIVMLLGGLWHGASWTFVAWGGLHGLYLAMERRFPGKLCLPRFLKGPCVFLLVSLTWIFFRAPSLHAALGYLHGILILQPGEWHGVGMQIGVVALFLLPLEWIAARSGDVTAPLRWPWYARAPLYVFLLWSTLGGIDGKLGFIYFRF